METEEGGMDVDDVEQQAPPLLVPEVIMPATSEKGEQEMEEGEGEFNSEDVKEGKGDLKNSEQQLSNSSECLDDPNFAIICSFLENFGQHIRLGEFPFDELQMMLENTTEVPERLVKLHIALLRRVFKTITVDKWERSLAKFGHTYCNQDGWEIERFGYKKAKLPTKLRILKNLLESQFDYNVKFKAEVNKLEAGHLRLIPLGRDCEGQVYWYQVDNDANLRVYREDVDEESWEIVASNREEFCDLIEKLQKGDVKRPEPDAVVIDEDSNEKDIETNEIILDTGKVNDNNEDGDESDDSEEDIFEKVHETKPTAIESSQLVSVEADPPVLEPVIIEKVESVCAIKAEELLEETGEQLSKSSPVVEKSNDKPAGESKSLNHTPEKYNRKDTLPSVEKCASKVSSESSIPSVVEPLVEEKIVSKAEYIPEPQKKLHQPYQDAIQTANYSTSLQTMDEHKSRFENAENVTTLPVPDSVLKIEEEIIVETAVKKEPKKVEVPDSSKGKLNKNEVPDSSKGELKKSEVSDPPNNSYLPDTAPEKAEAAKSPEMVSETCQATKTWVCGDEPKTHASRTEPMQIEGISPTPTPDRPSTVKDKTDSVLKDNDSTMEEQLPSVLSSPVGGKETKDIKKLDFPGSEPSETVALNMEETEERIKATAEKLPTNEVSAQDFEDKKVENKIEEYVQEYNVQVKTEPSEELLVKCEREITTNETDCSSTDSPEDIKSNQAVGFDPPEKTGVLQEKDVSDVQKNTVLVVPKVVEPEVCVKIENEQKEVQNQEPLKIIDTADSNIPSEITNDPSKSKTTDAEVTSHESQEECLESKAEDSTCSDNVFQNNLPVRTLEVPPTEPSSSPSIVPGAIETNYVANVPLSVDSKSSEEKSKSKETNSEPAVTGVPPISVSDSNVSSTPSPKQPYSISVLLEPKKTSEIQTKTPEDSITEPSTSCLVEERTEVSVKPNIDSESTDTKEEAKIEPSCNVPAITEATSLNDAECGLVTPDRKKEHEDIEHVSGEISSSKTNPSMNAEEPVTSDQPSSAALSENKLDLIHSEAESNVAGKTEESTSLPTNPAESTSLIKTVESEEHPKESTKTTTPIASAVVPPSTISNSPTKESKPTTSSLLGLASYDSSSDEGENETDTSATTIPSTNSVSESALKRKADGEGDIPVKVAKLEEKSELTISNPIVGDVVEEEIMHITGEGSGAMNEGGNDEALTSQRSQTLSSQEEADSSNDDSQESLEIQKPRKRGRPGKRGRKPGTKVGSLNTTPKERKPRNSTGPRGSREIARLGVPIETQETNGNGEANERPVRASRRIAQIRMKEEEERRKLEEERLAQLKADQLRKQQRKAEAEKLGGGTPKIKKSKKGTPGTVGDYLPSPSASESDSGEDDGDEFQVDKLKKGRKKKRRANGKQALKPGSKPWATSSSDEDSEAVEEEEEYHYEEEEQLVFNESDHEFSPESDLGEDSEAHPSRHARTAKRGEKAEEEETGCRKCGKGDHPEWILLCDKCDQGWHASCLRPQLWVIPEGEWFCPPCQHNMLVTKLSANLLEFDKLLKKRENDILRKQRLAFVNVSLNNVLPEKTEEEKAAEAQEIKAKAKDRERTSRRRRILSDEELSDTFINDRSDNEMSENSDDDSEDGPIYRLRARRAAKTFDYKEYDDMINSALRASDDEVVEEEQAAGAAAPENGTLNGNTKEEPKEGEGEESQSSIPAEEKHSGKNEAYEKYLQQQEEEFDSDDELMDEKERLRRKAAKSKGSNKKKKRSFRDLDDYTDEDNSDEDFKGSEAEDDEELDEDAVEEDESEWSGDHEESDDSLARRSRNTAKGKKVKYGRREEYLDVGAVRRSTRARRKARVSYDESDQDDDEEPEEKWQSDQSEEEEETPSESDDETYGKRKKKKAPPPRSAVPRFFLGTIGKETTKKAPKKKKRKVDEDDVDRAWSSSQGSKAKKKAAEEQVERRTRGRKINFKDILDSGESDDDGNIRPKRRRISSDEEEDEAETSRRLAEEIKAANQREAAMYAAMQKKNSSSSGSKSTTTPSLLASALSGSIEPPITAKKSTPDDPLINKTEFPPGMPQISASNSSNPLEMLSNSAKSLGGTLPLSSESLIAKVDAGGPPVLKPENSLSSGTLEMALSKPVPAPPIPPALAKALGRMKSSSSNPPAGPGAAAVNTKSHSTLSSESHIPAHPPPVITMTSATLPVVLQPPIQTTISSPPVTAIPPPQKHSRSKKDKGSKAPPSASPPASGPPSTPPTTIQSPLRPMTPPMQQQGLGGLPPQGLPPGLPMDIGRVPNPTLYQGNPAMRPFHPMWVRNPTPPPYGGGGGGPPTSIGKPPPLNSGPFMAQHGAQRPGFPSQPPPLRIPNPNPSSLQAFQHFKRDQVPGHGMYRMPPGQQGGLPGILAAGLMGQQGPPDGRFFAGPNPYAPYGILPPHTQSQPHPSMFGVPPYDFRPGEPFTKEEPRGTPPSTGTSSPPVSQPLPPTTAPTGPKDEAPPPSQTESEFGGLVSYFSSQRSEEDMDS